jgi:hypothetical protein
MNQGCRAHMLVHNGLGSFHLGQGNDIRHAYAPSQQGLKERSML